jgi:hypothetical protein
MFVVVSGNNIPDNRDKQLSHSQRPWNPIIQGVTCSNLTEDKNKKYSWTMIMTTMKE